MQFTEVKGADLRSGMFLKEGKDVSQLPSLTGQCGHGLHFGSKCYDRISTWMASEGK